MKQIPLSQGKFAIVDDSDYDFLNQWKWHIQKSLNTDYAIRTEWITPKKCICLRMHRVLLGVTDSKIKVDHKNGNGLDNQRENVRKSTPSQNGSNTRSRKNSSSKYLGVHFCNTRKKWVSQIQHEGKGIHLGIYEQERKAALSYNVAALILHGEFANLNQV